MHHASNAAGEPPISPKQRSKRQWVLFVAGLIAIGIGVGILGFFGIRKVSRILQKQKLLKEHVVLEIPDLHIEVPVLEGTDSAVLAKGVGHFPETGAPGSGNYCIAGHSSTLYKEYFNNLKSVEMGMQILLYDMERNCYCYTVTDSFVVNPSELWVLDDCADDRITLITCTDDGTQRQVVVGTKDVSATQESANTSSRNAPARLRFPARRQPQDAARNP